MEPFNKIFFRFAFGFIGIIVFSVSVIFVVQTIKDGGDKSWCIIACSPK